MDKRFGIAPAGPSSQERRVTYSAARMCGVDLHARYETRASAQAAAEAATYAVERAVFVTEDHLVGVPAAAHRHRTGSAVTYACRLCGQHIDDGKACGCGARKVAP